MPIKLSSLKSNPGNPRLIKDSRFKKLVQSIKEFPKMMELRPMIIDKTKVIIGGNMRYKALQELGYTEIPDEWVKRAADLNEDDRARFIVTDNNNFGEWDWDELANSKEWDLKELENWGLEIPGLSDTTPVSFEAKNKFTLKVICDSESQKRELTNKLIAEGYKVK